MYASDYPHSDMEWNRVQAIKGSEALSGAEKADLLGENARRFLQFTDLKSPWTPFSIASR